MNKKPQIQKSHPKDSPASRQRRVLEGLDNAMKENNATGEQKPKAENESPTRLTPHNA